MAEVFFKKGEFDNPYSAVSDYLTEYFYKTDRYFDDLIVYLSTDNGVTIDKELALVDQFTTYSFDNDWYEGGDIILYGFTRVSDVFMLNSFKEFDRVQDTNSVVLCKDCKHRPIKKEPYYSGFDLDFPPDSKCPCFCKDDEYYSWQPADNWYCANGEKKNDKV
jgi:hypothetical protein